MGARNLTESIIKTIQKHNMLSPGDHVLAAVSGGADSVALLYGLLEVKEAFSLTVSACHVNHNLRGDASLGDAEFVKTLCRDLGLRLLSYSANIDSKGASLEEAARKARYFYLYEAAKSCGANKIALGHNENDNAETLLIRLCRGTGLKGAGGIPPVRKSGGESEEYTLIRPLIETSRYTIEKFLLEKDVSYRTDNTNFDPAFLRNNIRRNIIPALEEITPQAVSLLAKSARLLREEEALLDDLASGILRDCLSGNRLNTNLLSKTPETMQKRVIRSAIQKLHSLRDISSIHIEQILSLGTGKETHLPFGLIVRREYEFLVFISGGNKVEIEESPPFCYDIPLNAPIFIPAINRLISAYIMSYEEYLGKIPQTTSQDICTKHFNYDKITGSLQVRTRRPGDRITVSGVGTKKIKNEFSDRKIPKGRRDAIPLLAAGKDILWIIDESGLTNRAYAPEPGCKVLVIITKKECSLE